MPMSLGSYASRVVATLVVAQDGTGDYSDIQSAINALPSGGGVVYIREGTYDIITSITFGKNNIRLEGAGSSTIINATAGIVKMFNISSYSDITLANFSIDANSNAQFCIHATNGIRVFIENILAKNATDSGIKFSNSATDCYLRSVVSHNNSVCGLYFASSAGVAVISSTIYSNSQDGIFLESGTSINLSGCTIFSNSYNGIYLYGAVGVVISACLIYSNIRNGIFADIATGIPGSNCINVVISSNIIYDNDFNNTSAYNGIYAQYLDKSIIVGNRCYDNDNYEIKIDSTSDRVLTLSNNIYGTDRVGALSNAGTNGITDHNILS